MKFVLDREDYVVEYYVTENVTDNLPPYGISVSCTDSETETMNNIFFTKEEAFERCKWLAENEVLPEIFRDMMEDIML